VASTFRGLGREAAVAGGGPGIAQRTALPTVNGTAVGVAGRPAGSSVTVPAVGRAVAGI
jgi:hypothetical protein